MFEFLRNLTKSAEEKRQETIAAYVDGALNGRSRQQFEQEMAQDDELRQEVAQLQLIKQSLRQLPQREVPRNFILDPAEYSRPPARQPWVQAYPVLRTATAMAAFFFMFALVAGAFTQFGGSIPSNLAAPAADVAQMEESEAVESLAFEADAVEEAEEAEPEVLEMFEADAADAAADEEASAAEIEMMEEEAMAEVAVEEMAEDEEVVVEETAEEAADEESAANAAPMEAPAADDVQDDAEDGEVLPTEATAVANATSLPHPTPTVSSPPRVAPPTPLPDRDMVLAETAEGDAANEVADAPEPVDEEAVEDSVERTAVPSEDSVNLTVDEPASPLLWWQIGLGGLLLLLVGFTLYARRQR